MSLPFDAGCGKYAASDQTIDFEVTENGSFANMFEIVNMRQMLNVLWKCALTMTAMVQSSALIEPF